MIRESLRTESRHATMAISTRHGYVFQRRPDLQARLCRPANRVPSWLDGSWSARATSSRRIIRLTARWSKWALIPFLGACVYIGLAATRSNRTASALIIIDGFSVVANERPSNEPPAVSITSPTAQSQYTAPMTPGSRSHRD